MRGKFLVVVLLATVAGACSKSSTPSDAGSSGTGAGATGGSSGTGSGATGGSSGAGSGASGAGAGATGGASGAGSGAGGGRAAAEVLPVKGDRAAAADCTPACGDGRDCCVDHCANLQNDPAELRGLRQALRGGRVLRSGSMRDPALQRYVRRRCPLLWNRVLRSGKALLRSPGTDRHHAALRGSERARHVSAGLRSAVHVRGS